MAMPITNRPQIETSLVFAKDKSSTFDEFREAVTTFEDTARTARRVLGGAHPLVPLMEKTWRAVREQLPSLREGK